MRVALSQFNAVVGDLQGNCRQMQTVYDSALQAGVDLLVFPELAVCGYPPEDLVYRKQFVDDNRATVEALAAACPETTIVVGFVESSDGRIYNSAAVLKGGAVRSIYRKGVLPNFAVFDEQRYFRPGVKPVLIEVEQMRVALTICRDMWDLDWLKQSFKGLGRIDLILNLSASPFHMGKIAHRERLISLAAGEFGAAVGYCNLVGGQDELVFDGRSMFADSSGAIVAQAEAFEEDLVVADVSRSKDETVVVEPVGPAPPQPGPPVEEVYQALVLGTRDYTRKNGFTRTLLGLSGGIDSAVTAAVAVAALGPKNVTAITMPSRFNSPETISDAGALADNLGIELLTIPIGPILAVFHESLQQTGSWDAQGIAYENLQARIRGTLLMSLSNQQGALVLTTGNKSEISVGYSTLYGDTAGGFAVIKDCPKTLVYQLAEHINRIAGRELIPLAVITRPPSAELRPDQKDADSLPDYALLDEILKAYVEQDQSMQQLRESGMPMDVVSKVVRLVDRNEYKRRQSPPGVRITPKAFGKDRRLPITNRYNPCPPADS